MRKGAVLFLATVMMLEVAGCGQKGAAPISSTEETVPEQSEREAVAENSLFNTNGELPIVNEEITLKVLTMDDPTYPTGHADTSKIFDYLTEKTGIKFEIESYVAEELEQKLPLIMAGNDLPDIFWRVFTLPSDAMSYGEQGKVLELDNLVDEYGYYTKQALENVEDAMGYFKSANGHIYGLPRINGSPQVHGLSINEVWLDNLGLDHPKTLEELYDVLVAFKEQDANGNGDPNDEIPMTVSSGSDMNFKKAMMSYVGINQYFPATGATFDADDDGKVYLTPISEKYRYVLETLHKFYEEGLLDNELFTHTSDEYTAKREDDRVGVTVAWTPQQKEKPNITQRSLLLTSSYCDEYVQPAGSLLNPCLFSISATTQYPEICFLLGDYIYSEEISWLLINGMEGETFEWEDKENFQIKSLKENEYYLYVNSWERKEWVQESADEGEREDTAKKLENYKVAFQHFIPYTVEETDTISALATDIGSVIDENFVQFVTGDKELNDVAWDEYVALVESLGAEELTAVYQSAYDRFVENTK